MFALEGEFLYYLVEVFKGERCMDEGKIQDIDKNLKVETNLKLDDICFYDARREPFRLYGLYNAKTEAEFKRLPDDVAQSTNQGVAALYKNTAGGRVRFSTDSSYVAVKAVMPGIGKLPHMPLSGSAGFDLYINDGGKDVYFKTFMPPYDIKDGYESVIHFEDRRARNITIHFPLYSCVSSLYIGLQEDANVGEGAKYKYEKPVLYYGSSITQGGCASRPGNCYQNIISAKLGCDHINLGFSGSARGEDIIADYIASLDYSIFVCDYDHNAPSVEHLEKTHEKLFLKVREAIPEVPIVLVSKPDFDSNPTEIAKRRDVIYRTYMNALRRGDKNVYFIDGERLFKDENRDACTVDGCHPNDAGFVRMAEVIGFTVDKILRKGKSHD